MVVAIKSSRLLLLLIVGARVVRAPCSKELEIVVAGANFEADTAVVFASKSISELVGCGRGLSVNRVVAIVVVLVVVDIVEGLAQWLFWLNPDEVSLVVTTSFWSRVFEPKGTPSGPLRPLRATHSTGLHSATQLETTARKKTMSEEGNLNASNGASNLCPLASI